LTSLFRILVLHRDFNEKGRKMINTLFKIKYLPFLLLGKANSGFCPICENKSIFMLCRNHLIEEESDQIDRKS
jgi:hypothetical protein